LEHVGRGHFGDVFKATDSRLQRFVAVKVPRTSDLTARERDAFLREARTAAKLRHPNIVTVHDVGTTDEGIYIASEFIDGVNLADLIAGTKLAPVRAAEIAAATADALEHAHQQEVVHRDLKPRNIMLDAAGEPHLLDFGLAKQSAAEFTITSAGDILGTPAYMAPEQARGEASNADARTDVYALGVTLYEMLTGRRPFEGNFRGLLYQILHDDATPPRKLVPEIPRDLETICLKAMSKPPALRYESAAAMAADLRRFLASEPILARRAGLVERGWRWCRRNPLVALSSSIAGIAVLLLVALQFNGRANPPGTQASNDQAQPTHPSIYGGHQEPPSDAFRHQVAVVTEPPGAEVVTYLLDWDTGRPVVATRQVAPTLTPTQLELSSGTYLVVVHDQNGFHEVLRTVPRYAHEKLGPFAHEMWTEDTETHVLHWPRIKIFPMVLPEESLVASEGAEDFQWDPIATGPASPRWRIPAFDIEPTEVSIEKYHRLERTKLEHRDLALNLPAGSLSWDEATVYAESRGLRLPDVLEAEVLATRGGLQQHPWGNSPPPADNWTTTRPVDAATHDQTSTNPPIFGLESSLLEWTWTRTQEGVGVDRRPGLRFIVRGGPPSLISPAVPVGRFASVNQYTAHPALGLRCVRSKGPRLSANDFISELP
jgi:hypothetical protein